jgi:antitoxin FitA
MSAAGAAAPRTSLLIRNLEPGLKRALQRSADLHGVSVEEEARRILAGVLAEFTEPEVPLPASLGAAMAMLFGKDGGVELQTPPREMGRAPPDFGEACPP